MLQCISAHAYFSTPPFPKSSLNVATNACCSSDIVGPTILVHSHAVKSLWLIWRKDIRATSTAYWCIASNLKVPLNFCGMNKKFLWVDLFLFNQLLLRWYYNDKKIYRILVALPFTTPSLPWSLAFTPWAMSLYFKFHAIYFWLLNQY